jgi:hypothetical protein
MLVQVDLGGVPRPSSRPRPSASVMARRSSFAAASRGSTLRGAQANTSSGEVTRGGAESRVLGIYREQLGGGAACWREKGDGWRNWKWSKASASAT